MPYHVVATTAASREYKRLDAQVQGRVSEVLKALREDPRPPGVKKLTGSSADWRVRVGDYRILYEIDDSEMTVTIWRIVHRSAAYR
jgi:mRNA interferase RelE/StbE